LTQANRQIRKEFLPHWDAHHAMAIQVCDLHSYFTDTFLRGSPNEKRIHVHEKNTQIVDA
jgi:hypothetical protein